jgi:putative transposase
MDSPSQSNRRHRKNYNEPGHAHELTFSCYQGYPFLSRERTCRWLVEAIEHARSTLEYDLWAWVFMPNHVHLFVRPRQNTYDVATFRRLIKEPVSRKAVRWLRENDHDWLTKIERKRGNRSEYLFWQSGGGYDRNITETATLLKMIDYLHKNPVRKGLVERAIDWMWSSAAWFIDQIEVPLIPDPIPPEWLNEH